MEEGWIERFKEFDENIVRGVGLDLTISNLKALDQYTLYD